VTRVDHKRIGVMYVLIGLCYLLRGLMDAIMWLTTAIAAGGAQGYLAHEQYARFSPPRNEHDLFSWRDCSFMVGLIGLRRDSDARLCVDVALPVLNAISLVDASGSLLVNISMGVG